MIIQIPVEGFDNNFSYFVVDKSKNEIAIVDPSDPERLDEEIRQNGLSPSMVLLTHTHRDHCSGVSAMVERYGIPVYMHKNAAGKVDVMSNYEVLIDEDDSIQLGELKIKILYTPGHADDAICYYIDKKNAADSIPKLITGDTLFVEGCGRADLKGSNAEDLFKSLQRIKALPDETEVYPGHDYGSRPFSTIAYEKKHNKFLKCSSLEEFKKLRLPST